jgi:hypothetical protein
MKERQYLFSSLENQGLQDRNDIFNEMTKKKQLQNFGTGTETESIRQ